MPYCPLASGLLACPDAVLDILSALGESMATQLDQTQRVFISRPEAATYVRRRGRRLVALFIVVPLVAGLATASVLAQLPIRYQSTLRVIVPDELSNSASGIGLYLANLELRLSDPKVVKNVSKVTGVNSDAYLGGLALNRVGQSSSADFTFESTNPDTAAAVVEQVASAALQSMATEGLPFAKREVQLAEQSYQNAVNDLNAFRNQHDVVYPEEQYRQTVAEIEAARARVAEAQAVGDSIGAARAQASVQELTQRLTSLEGLLPEFQELDDARAVALELRSNARDRLASKQAEIRLTDPENVRQDVSTRPLSRLARVVQGTAAAVAASVFLLFALFVLPDLLRPRRMPR
jgi:hypothetical protein